MPEGWGPHAHVLSPERRALRSELSVRGALVETRAQYVTTIRGLARAAGILWPTCGTTNFIAKLEATPLDGSTRALIAPLVTVLKVLDTELRGVEEKLSGIAERDPIIGLCATVPGVGLIVAATFVSVIDDAKRFRNAHAVGAYLGLVPGEATTGGPLETSTRRHHQTGQRDGARHARPSFLAAAALAQW